MPALTHGRVINGFNAYPRTYSNKTKPNKRTGCNKKIYFTNGTIIPEKYVNSNSCSSQKCRRVLKVLNKKYPKSTLIRNNISQRGVGDSIKRNLLNKKTRNKASLAYKLNKNNNICNCYCLKLF